MEFINQLWVQGDLDKLDFTVTLLPNILQIVGTILTLLTALLSSLGKFEDARSKMIKNFTLSKSKERSVIEEDFLKNSNDLANYSRELMYGGVGIALITIGFNASAISLDCRNLTPYLLGPLLLVAIYCLYILYNFIKPLLKHRKLFLKRLITFFILLVYILGAITALIHLPNKISISLGFLSSTVAFLIIFIFVIETFVYNTIITNNIKKYQERNNKKEEKV